MVHCHRPLNSQQKICLQRLENAQYEPSLNQSIVALAAHLGLKGEVSPQSQVFCLGVTPNSRSD